jgi:hypothetical protein
MHAILKQQGHQLWEMAVARYILRQQRLLGLPRLLSRSLSFTSRIPHGHRFMEPQSSSENGVGRVEKVHPYASSASAVWKQQVSERRVGLRQEAGSIPMPAGKIPHAKSGNLWQLKTIRQFIGRLPALSTKTNLPDRSQKEVSI